MTPLNAAIPAMRLTLSCNPFVTGSTVVAATGSRNLAGETGRGIT